MIQNELLKITKSCWALNLDSEEIQGANNLIKARVCGIESWTDFELLTRRSYCNKMHIFEILDVSAFQIFL